MKSQRILLLGSASLGRQWVLEELGIPFSTRKSIIDESNPSLDKKVLKSEAINICRSNARMKMDFLIQNLHSNDYKSYYGILTLDTIVWLPPHHYMGKADTIVMAQEFLGLLNGKKHFVITTFNFLPFSENSISSNYISGIEETLVTFNTITQLLLDKYLASGECIGRAGGYAMQGMGVLFVKYIRGNFYNVIGLPISKILESIHIQNPSCYDEILASIHINRIK